MTYPFANTGFLSIQDPFRHVYTYDATGNILTDSYWDEGKTKLFFVVTYTWNNNNPPQLIEMSSPVPQ